jgi:hypothetical protein
MGCIPIMSEYSVYSDFVNVGYILKSVDYGGIQEVMSSIDGLDKIELLELMMRSIKTSSYEFSKEKYKIIAESFIQTKLK